MGERSRPVASAYRAVFGPIVAMLLAVAVAWPAPAAAQVESSIEQAPLFALCERWCALVDAKGQAVTDRVFDAIDESPGQAITTASIVYTRDGKKGAVDRSGRTAVAPTHKELIHYASGVLMGYDPSPVEGKPPTVTLYDESGRKLLQDSAGTTFGAWPGNNDGTGRVVLNDRCTENPAAACNFRFPAFFTGQSEVAFTYFTPSLLAGYAIAAVRKSDGRNGYGLVDEALQFVVEPKYASVDFSKTGLGRVTLANGATAVIDRQGRTVVEAGRYDAVHIPFSDDDPFITAFKPGEKNCGDHLLRDGSLVAMPAGLCAFSEDHGRSLDYFTVHGADGRTGAVDLDGRLIVPAIHEELTPLNRQYLRFGAGPRASRRFGIVDRSGREILPARYQWIRTLDQEGGQPPGLLEDAFIASVAENRVGLLDAKGQWRIPPVYRDGQVLSAQLLAFKEADGRHYRLFRADGTDLDLRVGALPRRPLMRAGKTAPDALEFEVDAPGGKKHGLLDLQGRVVLPADFRVLLFNAQDGLWRAHQEKDGKSTVALVDSDGKLQRPPEELAAIAGTFAGGAALAETSDRKPVLIGIDGRTLARFDTLFPELAARAELQNEVVAAIDGCVNPDPAAEPSEQPKLDPSFERICASNALREASRAVEKTYLEKLAGFLYCDPRPVMALHKAYARAVRAATDERAVLTEMKAFAGRILAAPECVKSADLRIGAAVPKPLQRELARQIDARDRDAGLTWRELRLADRKYIVAEPADLAAIDGPHWLFGQNADARWRLWLAADGSPQTVTGKDNGQPLFATQVRGAFDSELTYHAFDGSRYRAVAACAFYDADGGTRSFAICNEAPVRNSKKKDR